MPGPFSLIMENKQRRLNAVLKVTLAVVVGLLLGKALWCLVPKEKLLDQDLLYLVALGTAFEKQKAGDLQGAKETLKAAIAKWPRRYEAYMYLGNILLELGETNAALSNYMMAIKYCGTSPTNFVPMEVQIRERERLIERLKKLQGG